MWLQPVTRQQQQPQRTSAKTVVQLLQASQHSEILQSGSCQAGGTTRTEPRSSLPSDSPRLLLHLLSVLNE